MTARTRAPVDTDDARALAADIARRAHDPARPMTVMMLTWADEIDALAAELDVARAVVAAVRAEREAARAWSISVPDDPKAATAALAAAVAAVNVALAALPPTGAGEAEVGP